MQFSEEGPEEDLMFDYSQFKKDIKEVVRAMDNVIDRTIYPLKEQEDEAKNKRRMGLGLTGLANAGEMLGYPYGSSDFLDWMATIFKTCLLYTSPSPRDRTRSRMPSSA